MIKQAFITISDEEYYDDAQLLVRSFFADVKVIRENKDICRKQGNGDTCDTHDPFILTDDCITVYADNFLPDPEECCGLSRGEVHDIFKRRLYEALVYKTGRTLPWGFLTGVRPAKRAMELIRKSNDRPEGVVDADIISEYSGKYMTSEKKAALALKVAKNELKILKEQGISCESSPGAYNGFSLYAGIPFCPTTCHYCSFPSVPIGKCEVTLIDSYVDALCKEIEMSSYIYADALKKRSFYKGSLNPSSVYIGGGTPTSLSPEHLEKIISCINRFFEIDRDNEFCVEAGRPDSITAEKLELLKALGVNRISVNPQTVNQKTLDLIGRHHTADDFFKGFEKARQAGFDNINTDIILGLPGEGQSELLNTLRAIEQLKPESLTVHSLAIKRASRLNTDSDLYSDHVRENSQKLIEMTSGLAKRLGMSPYYMYRQQNMTGNFENTGFALPGKESLYNIVIMEEIQDILAAGAGASSKFMFENGRFERAINVKDVINYISRINEMCSKKASVLKAFYY